MTARQAAVLGSPVGHSLSPVLHAAAYRVLGLDWSYGFHQVDEAGLAGFLAGLDDSWAGLSLTMPLKRVAVGLCTELGATAAVVGAVNTITFDAAGERRGDNTDVPGMVNALAERGIERVPAAAVLGGGATAASTLAALARCCDGQVHAYLRSAAREAELQALAEVLGLALVPHGWGRAAEAFGYPLVVATTPGGATDQLVDRVPPGCGVLFDVAYDPWPTALAAAWAAAGGEVLGGLDLLVHQAVLQVELMTGLRGRAAELVAAMRHAGLAVLAARRAAVAGG
ncbi:MAG TPA: shikimate dehydrogenase [Sporichthyaceae bacterium]|nr:shikimate dehydrogenase [Sporichthyaceae bacterium]